MFIHSDCYTFTIKILTVNLQLYKDLFEVHRNAKLPVIEPKGLFEPINYILEIGGKKIRPLLVMMAIDAFGGDIHKGLDAALAVEVFHNFTLLHDDIMDQAPKRRGSQTVHEKWNVNTAILSGDAMMILANQFLESYDADVYKKLMNLFQQTALEVCIGQQYDMDFETKEEVLLEEYLEMIKLKTSVLVACALKMGGIIVGVDAEQAELIYQYGLHLGMAFQLQDDYLDAFGDPETFGKQVGGDIIENKKTYLYIKCLENLEGEEKKLLLNLYASKLEDSNLKIHIAKELFIKSGAVTEILGKIEEYTKQSFASLEKLTIAVDKKNELISFGKYLMGRKS